MATALTLVMPLQKRADISVSDFYDYWLNAHITLPARFPGIRSIWLNMTSFADSKWPAVPGTSSRPGPEDEIHGIPEADFATLADLDTFIKAATVQWSDGIHFLAEEITYRSLGENSQTVVEKSNPAPDGHDGYLRHYVFLRKKPNVSVADFRKFVSEQLVPAYAKSPDILKLRSHLFEEVEGTLEHAGVAMFKPKERQYQACVEVVLKDESALARFAASPAWTETVGRLGELAEAVHGLRATRTFTSKIDGQITLLGVRGVAVSDIIKKLSKVSPNQTHEDVSKLYVTGAHHVLHEHAKG